ncbi:Septin-domain-containing protein [Phlyctochytrium arcticum]|nr:Septin-domain-containing protein [Phlyctochytrium arcticum]
MSEGGGSSKSQQQNGTAGAPGSKDGAPQGADKTTYRAFASYNPVYTDEITLNADDHVTILQTYDDGWVMAYNLMSNTRGLLPFNFLEPINDSDLSMPESIKSSQSVKADNAASQMYHSGTGTQHANPDKASVDAPSLLSPAGNTTLDTIVPSHDFAPPLPPKKEGPSMRPISTDRTSSLDRNNLNRVTDMRRSPNPNSAIGTTNQDAYTASPLSSKGPAQSYNAMPQTTSAPGFGAGHASEKYGSSDIFRSNQDTSPERAARSGSIVDAVMAVADRSEIGSPSGSRTGSPAIPEIPVEQRGKEAKQRMDAINKARVARARPASELGTLKIAIAGDSGIGKTSLVRNFLATPEVVAAEPIPRVADDKTAYAVRASTSAIPSSGTDALNLTFIDTPGFGTHMDAMATIKPVVEYHLQQFQVTDQVFVRNVPHEVLHRFLATPSGGHTHVDILIFGILHRLKPVDIEYMRRLAPYVTIVPVILKCDTLTYSEVFRLKAAILEELKRAKVEIYGFGLNIDDMIALAKTGTEGCVPFAVSNSLTVDVGPAPSYGGIISPLGDRLNEFDLLKTRLFSTHTEVFRAITAQRFVSWRTGLIEYERQRRLEAEREAEHRAAANAAAQAQAQAAFSQQQQLYAQAVPQYSSPSSVNGSKSSTGGKILHNLFSRKGSSASQVSLVGSQSPPRTRGQSQEDTQSSFVANAGHTPGPDKNMVNGFFERTGTSSKGKFGSISR